MPEEFTIYEALNRLAATFLEKDSSGLVTAVAMGAAPDSKEDLTVFIDPAAAVCEENAILEEAKKMTAPFTPGTFRAGPWEGLAAVPLLDVSRAPLDIHQSNIPPVSTGTRGAAVFSGGKWYVLSSNHVLANNGQTPDGTKVFRPGPLDAIRGGALIATFTRFVPLRPPTKGPNQADCAWAELVSPPAPLPAANQVVTDVQASIRQRVSKTGRTTAATTSIVQFTEWHGLIDFNFGTYLFKSQFATWDDAGADPPFASTGDSGALVTIFQEPNQGVGLVCARGYAYAKNGEFLGYIIVNCPLDQVRSGMESNGLNAVTIYAVDPLNP